MTTKMVRGALLWLALALVCASVTSAQTAQDEVERLNREAMEAYHMLEVDKAGGMLEEALRIAEGGGVTAEAVALTHLNLGVVYIGALSDEAAGEQQFTAGLCLNRGIALDPLTSTPQMKEIFDRAQGEAGSGNCPEPIATAGAGGQAAVPSPGEVAGSYDYDSSAGPRMDDETPWDGMEREGPTTKMKRGFFQFGIAVGMTYMQPGMKADRDPNPATVFVNPVDPNAQMRTGPYYPTPQQAFVDGKMAMANDANAPQPIFYLPGTSDTGITDWVPDADSEDSYDGSYGQSCPGDGKSSGPKYADPLTGEGLLPTSYCVRVKGPGFVARPALRLAAGYFVTPKVSLAAIGRIQLGAGEGSLAGILLGARAEYLFLASQATGLSLSGFLGATVGQIQAKISSRDNAPWTVAGPVGAHVGMNVRYRFHKNFGIIVGPEVDVLFPDLLVNIDVPLGVEVAF